MMYSSDDDSDFFRSGPVAPLPNPGEGGPAAPGGNFPGGLLPSPGEGGPVFPGFPGGNFPGNLLPGPGEGGPVGPGDQTPAIPLPGPGEGGPVYPGRPGQTIPVRPVPNPPCYYCGPGRAGRIRFLNAAFGYRPFRIFVNNRFLINGLGYASMTGYGRISGGFQTITVTGTNGYIYLQKSMPVKADDSATIAIINTASGIDLLQISDTPCTRPFNMSCFRACNLALNSNPLDVILSDGRVVYSDVRFKEVTAFRRVRPGEYEFYLAETNLRPMPRFSDIETMNGDMVEFALPEALVSFYVDVRRNAMYTVYILSNGTGPDEVQTMVIEDR